MKKTLGFTLVEVLLVLGIVSLMTTGLFVFFNQERQETLINNHVKFLNILNQNKQNFATATANFSIITPVNLIAAGAVPPQMIHGGTIRNLFGGEILLSVGTTFTTNDSVNTTITNLPPTVCVRTVGEAGVHANFIQVNGTTVKNIGSPHDSLVIAGATLNCTGTTNTVTLRQVIQRKNLPPGVGQSLFLNTFVRQRNIYTVPTLGNIVSSPSVTCPGTSIWNGSYCGCNAGAIFNGLTCVAHNNPLAPGVCPLGHGWQQASHTCMPLPNPSPIPGASNPGGTTEVYIPGGTNTAGRVIPWILTQTGATQFHRTTPEGAAACTAPGSHYDGRNCLVCINSTWNGFRCVPNF